MRLEDLDDSISLTVFSEDDDVDEWLLDLCHDMVGLDSPTQARMVLMLHLSDKLEGVKWGGRDV
jgi:hypothetical protein